MKADDRLLCDVCEEEVDAEKRAVIGLDGRQYEVDLCAQHVRKLDLVLAQFIDAARPVEP